MRLGSKEGKKGVEEKEIRKRGGGRRREVRGEILVFPLHSG